MLRRLGIRGKVLATLSVPVLVLFLLAGIVSNQALQDLQTARATEELLEALEGAHGLTKVMQAERAVTLGAMVGDPEAKAKLDEVRAMTDAALGMSREAASGVDLTGLDPVVERALTGLDDQTAQFAMLREAVDGNRISPRGAFAGYTTVVERVARFPGVVATSLPDRRLGTIIQTQTDVVLLQEKYVQEQLFGGLVQGGLQSGGDAAVFLALFPSTNVAQEHAALSADGLGIDGLEVPPLRMGLGQYGSLRAIAAGSILNFVGLGNPQQWQILSQQQIDSYDEPIAQMGERAFSRASQVADDAGRTAVITIALSALAVVLSIVIAFTISRGIVIPLRRLTAAAGHVRDELPKLVEQVAVPGQGPDLTLVRIPVTTKDEVGQLAVAFNQVNATTIEVAQEQAALRASIAEMFVNVARRDQVLLNRQLSFIDALERTEEDPATLADLFRLDHLATRMRRNAESLLVLAGIETGRRLREPLPVSDVIRTASSEIEHYERIQLDLPIDPVMLGHTALSAAHLLAELLENATVFSDPGTPVQVSTGRDAEHVVVTVFDQGLGMTPTELGAANEKIKTTSASEVLGAERLGLFVVGRIAARLGALVELSAGPDGTGTLATVRLPLALFVDAERVPVTAPNQHAAVVESFVTPEAAADPVHEPAYAPVPSAVQDVPAGSVGSMENPAEPVDLAALTAGTTGLGLPKRRASVDGAPEPAPGTYREEDDAAAARSIPLAPRAEDLAGAAAFPAADDESWSPPVVEAKPLVVRRRGDESPAASGPTGVDMPWTPAPAPGGPAGLPTRTGSAGLPGRPAAAGLPTREPMATTGGVLPITGAVPTVAPSGAAPTGPAGPADPQERASMFSGFRSRRAELAAASLGSTDPTGPADAADGAERLAAVASGASAFFGRNAQPQEPVDVDAVPTFEVPALVADEPVAAAPADVESVAQEPEPFTGSTPMVGGFPLTRRARRGRHAYDPAEEPDTPTWAPPPASVDPAAATEDAPRWAASVQDEGLEPGVEPVAEPFVVPALVADEPAEPAPPVWDAGPQWPAQDAPVVDPWQVEQPADEELEAPVWAPAEPVAVEQLVEEAFAAAPSEVTEQPAAAGGWSAPQGAWAPTTEVPAPLPAPLPAAVPVKAKRRLWPFGKKRSGTSSEVAAVPPAVTPPAEAVLPVPSFAPEPVADVLPPAPPPAAEPVDEAPARTSAWGPVQPGAHAGATAFFAPREVVPEGPVEPVAPVAWDVPSPHGALDAPLAPPAAGPAGPGEVTPSAPATAAWAPAPGFETPAEQWRPVPVPEAAAPIVPAEPAAAPTSFTPAPASRTTFTPQVAGFTDDVTSMLAQRADLAQQALAELSQLSSYRPQAVSGGSSSLVRRTPGTIPAAPEIKTSPAERPTRDANQVRSLLSSFQSGTVRGREAADGAPQTADAGALRNGAEDDGNGPPEPVGEPDMTQRSTTW